MPSTEAKLKNVFIISDSHTYDGLISEAIFHFIDKNNDQIMDKDDVLDFYVELQKNEFKPCAELPKNVNNSAIEMCKKLSKDKYKNKIEELINKFHQEIQTELIKAKKDLIKIAVKSESSKICDGGNGKSAILKNGAITVADINSNGVTDEITFKTSDGTHVHISSSNLFCQQTTCCKQIDTNRTFVEAYLKVFDSLFDYIEFF